MASLQAFATRIRNLSERVEENIDETVIKTAIAIDQVVVTETPVITGRARGGWQVGIDKPILEDNERLDPSGADTISANEAKIRTRQPGQDIYISNNVVYIGKLNEGSSSQAPAGYIEAAVLTGVAAIKGAKVVK